MTDAKTDAWMPLWIGAYLADTQHLARDEHGAYLLLLMAYWRTGSALPDDDKRLSAIAKASPKEWKTLRPTMAEFFTVADGFWSHKRVDKELAASIEHKNKAVSKAKKGAQARWGLHKEDAPSIQQAKPKQCPTPTPKEPKGSKKINKKSMLPENFEISERVHAWADEKGHTRLTEHLEDFIGKCKAKGYEYTDWDEAFMNAVRNDWAGFSKQKNTAFTPQNQSKYAAAGRAIFEDESEQKPMKHMGDVINV